MYTHVMWKFKVPHRVHVFLWLLSNNRLLNRDNLTIRRKLDDMTCLFCAENETINNLFFNCCVAKDLALHF